MKATPNRSPIQVFFWNFFRSDEVNPEDIFFIDPDINFTAVRNSPRPARAKTIATPIPNLETSNNISKL